MTSTRLPGKILKEVNHKSLLDYHINRLQQTGFEIVIATTTNVTDDVVNQYAINHQIKIFRGSENNVLSRYYYAAKQFNFDIIVRVTSDCPLIDPHLIRNSVIEYVKFSNPNLYLSNSMDRTFARGFDFEIFSFPLLEDAFKHATDVSDLEHVTPYIWKNKSHKTELYKVGQPQDNSQLRLTVDTAEDFELIKQLIENYNADELPYTEIEKIMLAHPELIAINATIEQKKV